MRALGNLPVVNANRVEQERTHQPTHTSSNNPDLHVLFARNERRIRLLVLQIGDTVEPCAIWVVDLGKGRSLGEGVVDDLEAIRGSGNAEVGEGVQTAAGWCVVRGQPNESGAAIE